ncbi:MAG: hypothetical protein MR943_08885 [Lachnobacterium sp.]|nr:hypothetical protein [Lachnobacterium sp.]
MKRFVTYLYEYDRTIRGRNVGFIRNDIRNDRCLMDIHIRGLERIKEKAPIYLIVRDGECVGIPAGEIVLSQGIGNAFLELPGNHIGKTNYNSGDIQAVIVRYGNGKMLLGSYVQHPASDLLSGTFTKWEAQAIPESPEPDPNATRGENDDSGSIRPVSEVQRGQNDDSSSIRPVSEIQRGQNDDFDSTRPDVLSQQGTTAPTEEKLCPPTYKRIAITDIRSFPAQNWHLCSNSFLVHGFFCYHYLILKTVNAPNSTQIYLGVPGIYASQERMMALLFGFNDFEVDTDHITQADSNHDTFLNDDTTDAMQPSEGTFGYWLCQLEV